MLGAIGAVVIWGLLGAGSVDAPGAGEHFLHRTAGARAPLPSELLMETLRMDQAGRTQRWQTQKFEAELQCRRYPDKCPPLFEIIPHPRRDLNGGVLVPGQDQEVGPSKPSVE